MAAERQRGKYWVSPRIQGRLIARIACYWCAYHLILWHSMFVVRYVTYRVGLITGESESQSLGAVYSQFTEDFSMLAICAILLAPIFLYDLYRNSHRIAGPLVRFQNSLKRMMNGETIRPFKLRDGDLLTEFQDVFNDFLVHYNKLVEKEAPPRSVMSEDDAARVERITQTPDPLSPESSPAPTVQLV